MPTCTAKSHRAGLDDKGDAKANKDGDVVVHVCGTHDHLLRAAHNQGVQELHKAEQEEGDDDQREDQAHDPPGNVPHSREGTSGRRRWLFRKTSGLGLRARGLGSIGLRSYGFRFSA